MPVGSSLLTLPTQYKMIPIIESRVQFMRALETRHIDAIVLRHCNLFEFAGLMERAYQRELATYVSIDHIDGINADSAGLRYLVDTMHVAGIISSHSRTLSLGKSLGLETIQRIFALDSTGLESALESVESVSVDLLDIAPALVVPHVVSQFQFSFPFIASGLIQTAQQVDTVLHAGAKRVVIARDELWL